MNEPGLQHSQTRNRHSLGLLHQAAGAAACRALQHGALQGQLRTEECSAGLKVKGLRPLAWEVKGAMPPGAPGVLDRGPSLKA